jgi:hypothetical protein
MGGPQAHRNSKPVGNEKAGSACAELMNEFDASIEDEKATKVGPAGIDIAYQRLGNPDVPVVLLIMGIAA